MSLQNVESLKPTGLFTNYIYKAIPLVFDESMSYYETLLGLLAYLKNTVIPTVNNNADAVSELQNLYTELHDYVENYFNNLDVQQEINNKLDQMVEDGTFQNILTNYANVERIYNTFIEAQNDFENLYNNMKIKTLGYYEINDGGNAQYLITNTKSETQFQIKINDSFYATLITEKKFLNVLKLGLKNDGNTDNLQLWNNIYNFIRDNINNLKYLTIFFPQGIKVA